jgi:hypothetical protein
MPRKTETEMALGVMRIANGRSDGLATFRRCRAEMPGFMNFTAEDNALSGTRPGETMWHQQVRNIKSHDGSGSNAIGNGWLQHVPKTGYKITKAGRAYLENFL